MRFICVFDFFQDAVLVNHFLRRLSCEWTSWPAGECYCPLQLWLMSNDELQYSEEEHWKLPSVHFSSFEED